MNFCNIASYVNKGNKGEDPSDRTYKVVKGLFRAMKKADPNACFVSIYDAEPGEPPIAPLSDLSQFRSDLGDIADFVQVSNSWDMVKIDDGQIDKKTGNPKKPKAVYVTVRVYTRYTLQFVIDKVAPAMAKLNGSFRKKDMEALASRTLCAIVGTANGWEGTSLLARLWPEVEKHEEWIQGNVKDGYTAQDYLGTPLPDAVIRRLHVRLPEGSDILLKADLEFIEYNHHLRNLLCIEASTTDLDRLKPLLKDFDNRGKMNCVSKDSKLLWLDYNQNAEEERMEFYKGLVAQMNYEHVHVLVSFPGVQFLLKKSKVFMQEEGVNPPYKYSNLKREILDIRLDNGERVFLGVLARGGGDAGRISCLMFNSDENELFVQRLRDGKLASYLRQLMLKEKGFNESTVNSIMGGFSDSHRMTALDSRWDPTTRTVKTLQSATQSSFIGSMTKKGIAFAPNSTSRLGIHPELFVTEEMRRAKATGKGNKIFTDEAMEKVAAAMNFKKKEGYNPAPADAASNAMSDASTNGAETNRSVTTQKLQGEMMELRGEMHRLRDRLLCVSPDDPLITTTRILRDDFMDTLSLNSDDTALLTSIFKDTKSCVNQLKFRIAEIENGRPPPSQSGSAAPPPASAKDATEQGEEGLAQGK